MGFIIGALSSLILIFLWGAFYYSRDPHHERLKNIATTIFYGFISFFLSIIIIIPVAAFFGIDSDTIDVLFYSGNLLTITALAASEEFSKLLVLRHIILKNKNVDEHTDGVFYGALAGLGFAAIENFFYALSIDPVSGVVRALLIPLLHSATGAVLGFFLIEKRLHDKMSHNQNAWLAFGITTLFHTLYNYFVIMTDRFAYAFLLTLLMWLGLLLLVAFVTNTSRKRDFEERNHTEMEKRGEEREEGRTYAFLSFFISLLALFLIFPMIMGPISIGLGVVGLKQGARKWGTRAIRFAIASTVIGYIGSVVSLYI